MKAIYIGNKNKDLIDHTLTINKTYTVHTSRESVKFFTVTDDLGKNIVVNTDRFKEAEKLSLLKFMASAFKHECLYTGTEIQSWYARKQWNRFIFDIPEEKRGTPKCVKCGKPLE